MFDPHFEVGCTDGSNPHVTARGVDVNYHGEWQYFCQNRSDLRMSFYTFPKGLWEKCKSQEDCNHLNCPATCVTNEFSESTCQPSPDMPGSCMSIQQEVVHPEAMLDCPRDPRDEKCMDIKHNSWDPTGCEIFEAEAEEFHPSVFAKEIAPRCEEFLRRHTRCLWESFGADPDYLHARLPPPHIQENMWAAMYPTGPHFHPEHYDEKQCILISQEKANRMQAMPCHGRM
mmetsp:Transcript_65129/g.187423  ORF Transcript_65129/g.187423 Transcript_65129/m.187423 type:complete len:229 (+) Transcript_65129:3-689(+)